MSRADVDAKRIEIRQRYARQARQRGGNESFREAELRRLYRGRGVPEADVANTIVEMVGESCWAWSKRQLGELVGLTFAERIRHGIRSFECTDRSPEEVRQFFLDRKRDRDRIAKQRGRAAKPKAPKSLSRRAGELLDEFVGCGWLAETDLVDRVAALKSFRDQRGRALDRAARKVAVHRAMQELHNAGKVDREERDKMPTEKRGRCFFCLRDR